MSGVILSVDPGGTTGLAYLTPNGHYLTNIALTPEDVWECIVPDTIERVICENYAGQIISTYGLHTVRIIGGVMALCWKFNIPYQGRPPQARKPMLLKAREYLKANKGESFVVHEVDALAHLMVWQYGHTIKHKPPQDDSPPKSKLVDFSKIEDKYDPNRRRYGYKRGRGCSY